MTAGSSLCLSAAIMTTILAAPAGAQERSPAPEERARAVESIERLDDLRGVYSVFIPAAGQN